MFEAGSSGREDRRVSLTASLAAGSRGRSSEWVVVQPRRRPRKSLGDHDPVKVGRYFTISPFIELEQLALAGIADTRPWRRP